MSVAGIGAEGLKVVLNGGGAKPRSHSGTVSTSACGFNGALLHGTAMCPVSAAITLVACEQRRNDHGVGLGAAREEEHVGGLVSRRPCAAAAAETIAAIARAGSSSLPPTLQECARMGSWKKPPRTRSRVPRASRRCRAIIPQRRRWCRKAVQAEAAIDKQHTCGIRARRDVMEFPHLALRLSWRSAVGCEPARIAKTLSFAVGDRGARGVREMCSHRESEVQGPVRMQARMLLPKRPRSHAGGRQCAFAVNEGCDVPRRIAAPL